MESVAEYNAVIVNPTTPKIDDWKMPPSITDHDEQEFVRRFHNRDETASIDVLLEGLPITVARAKQILSHIIETTKETIRGSRRVMAFYEGMVAFIDGLSDRADTTVEEKIRKASEFLPDLSNLVYPRRYKRPDGYCSPAAIIIPATAAVWSASFIKKDGDLPEGMTDKRDTPSLGATFFMTCRLISLRVPTYFVGKGMASAVSQTDLPKDFSLGSLQWPHDALVFQIPRGTIKCPRGSIVSVAVGKITPGRYVVDGFRYTGGKATVFDISGFDAETNECHIIAISDKGQTFFWACPMDSASVHDSSLVKGGGLFVEPNEDELEFINKDLPVIGLQLILCMIACPERVESGRMWTPQKRRMGMVTQHAIWHPNFFGRAYSLKTKTDDNDDDGHKGVKRMHWRRGHFRGQRFGSGNSQVKVIWIEPVLVNSKIEKE